MVCNKLIEELKTDYVLSEDLLNWLMPIKNYLIIVNENILNHYLDHTPLGELFWGMSADFLQQTYRRGRMSYIYVSTISYKEIVFLDPNAVRVIDKTGRICTVDEEYPPVPIE